MGGYVAFSPIYAGLALILQPLRGNFAYFARQRKIHNQFFFIFVIFFGEKHLYKADEFQNNLPSQNSIAFGKSTSQRIYSKQSTHKIGGKPHKCGLKHALHTMDGHFK